MTITEYSLPENLEDTKYCVFPDNVEGHEFIFFHATHADNFVSIVKEGFRIPDSENENGLRSVSFARRSNLSFTHAMNRRVNDPGEYVIFAVRYETLNRPGLKANASDIHDYTLDPAPNIIGFCRVPESYEHR